jgi:hypothetical protein
MTAKVVPFCLVVWRVAKASPVGRVERPATNATEKVMEFNSTVGVDEPGGSLGGRIPETWSLQVRKAGKEGEGGREEEDRVA